jgi:hypothetical protein
MLKVDNNPIEWPPPSVVQDKIPPTDKTEDMVVFITQLRQWYMANAPPEAERRSPLQRPPANGTSEQVRRAPSRYDISGSATRKQNKLNVCQFLVKRTMLATNELALVVVLMVETYPRTLSTRSILRRQSTPWSRMSTMLQMPLLYRFQRKHNLAAQTLGIRPTHLSLRWMRLYPRLPVTMDEMRLTRRTIGGLLLQGPTWLPSRVCLICARATILTAQLRLQEGDPVNPSLVHFPH